MEAVWEDHGVHFRPRDQQVPKYGTEHIGSPWLFLECLAEGGRQGGGQIMLWGFSVPH